MAASYSYRHLLVLLLALLLVVKPYTLVQCRGSGAVRDSADDLEEGNEEEGEEYSEGDEDYEEEDVDPTYDDEEEEEPEDVLEDDGDVIALGEVNFNETIEKNEYVMVKFYASWCEHCKDLAPMYREVATLVKPDNIVLARVEGQAQHKVAERFDVDGFPTFYFFKRGIPKLYKSGRTKDAIISYLKKQISPSVVTVNTKAEAEEILQNHPVVAFAFVSDLKSPESLTFSEVCDYEDEVFCVQSDKEEVAKALSLPKGTKAPALALLKKVEEKFTLFEGEFKNTTISDFIKKNVKPLIVIYSESTSESIFGHEAKKQVILFSGPEYFQNLLPIFQTVARKFKHDLFFVHINSSDTKEVETITSFFGVQGLEPQIRGFMSDEQGVKYRLKKEITLENLEEFARGVLDGTLETYYKSQPIPLTNDDDVVVVVGETFDKIVLDETKDVLFEVYAPWCGHCQRLEPIYKKLGQRFRNVESMVIAKFDGNANEHPLVEAEGYPTILFYPAFNKTQPIKVTVDRALKPLTKFLKEHAAIPFTLPKKGDLLDKNAPSSEEAKHKDEGETESSRTHDEL